MKKWLHKIEVAVDRLIPFMLVLLLAVIVLELGFSRFVDEHRLGIYLEIADYTVIAVFVLDLGFKYVRIKPFAKFLKKSWLDILAVFPFFLVFRLAEGIIGAVSTAFSETAKVMQSIFHESVEAETVVTEVEKIVKEGEKIGKASRSARFTRFLRPILRLPRFLKAVPFYEKPTGKHHRHERR